MFGFSSGKQDDGATVSPLVVTASPPTLDDHIALASPPKLSDRRGWGLGDIAGKIWSAPNTVAGLLYGGVGMGVGEVRHLLGRQEAPGVRWRDNAVQFTNNPFGGAGAITIGNTTTYNDDPYTPKGRAAWARTEANEGGHPIWEHERQHTIQGQQLGPLYLPSNLLGGLNALAHGEDWWGGHNWNEQGPKASPPAPWLQSGQS